MAKTAMINKQKKTPCRMHFPQGVFMCSFSREDYALPQKMPS